MPIWNAFNELHRTRPSGFGITRIPIVEIKAWLDVIGYTDASVRQEFYELIVGLDEAWIDWYNDEETRADRERERQDAGKVKK